MLKTYEFVDVIFSYFQFEVFAGTFDTKTMATSKLPCHRIIDNFRRFGDRICVANRTVSLVWDLVLFCFEFTAQVAGKSND
jgi:hypothetical protein